MLNNFRSYIKMRQAEKCLNLIQSAASNSKHIPPDLVTQIIQNEKLFNGFLVLEDKKLLSVQRAFGGQILSAQITSGGSLYYLDKFERNKERFYGFISGLVLGLLLKYLQS